MSKSIKLVLSGSGMKFPVHVGAINRLTELGYNITEVCGTSGGALVAAALASGFTPGNQLVYLIKKTLPGKNKLIDYSVFSLLTKWGLVKGDKLLNAMSEFMVHKFSETKIPLYIVTTNLNRQIVRIFSSVEDPDANVALAARASMSIPGIFAPVMIDGEYYVDGGGSCNYMLNMFGEGQDVIGLRFGSISSLAKSWKDVEPRKISKASEFIEANGETVLESSTREHMADAVYAKTIFLTSEYRSLSFSITEKDVDKMLQEGADSVNRWISKIEKDKNDKEEKKDQA